MGDKQVTRKRAKSRLEKMASKTRGKQTQKGGPPKNKKLVSQTKGNLPGTGQR